MKSTLSTGRLLLPMILCAPLLSGCVMAPLLIGGAAVTTATVVTDRRTAGTIVSDEVIERRVSYEINQALGANAKSHITVTSYEGRVLLSGEVSSMSDRRVAQQVASVSADVAEVVNELAVMDPTSVTTRLSDSMLAAKVRSAIIGNGQISLNQMKVTVDRGIVYLMGLVTREEAAATAQTAAQVSGVQKVVTCFSIESAEEVARRLKNLQSPSASEQTNP